MRGGGRERRARERERKATKRKTKKVREGNEKGELLIEKQRR